MESSDDPWLLRWHALQKWMRFKPIHDQRGQRKLLSNNGLMEAQAGKFEGQKPKEADNDDGQATGSLSLQN